jgi:hypothetical protein
MNLRLEVVEHRDLVLAGDETIDQMRSDVAGATGHENRTNRHVATAPGLRHTEAPRH